MVTATPGIDPPPGAGENDTSLAERLRSRQPNAREPSEPGGIRLPIAWDASHASFAAPRALGLESFITTVYLRRHFVLLALLIPTLIGIGAALLIPNRFMAESALIVFVSRESAGTQDITGFGPTVLSVEAPKVVQSEIDIVKSDDVIRKALAKIGPDILYPSIARRRLLWLLPPLSSDDQLAKASELFRKDLHAEVALNTNILRLRFSYPDRQKAIQALTVLIDAYFDQRRVIFQGTSSAFLVTELSRYAKQLGELEEQIQQVKTDHNVLDIGQDMQLASNRLDSITQQSDQVRGRREAVQTQIATARSELASQPAFVFSSRETTNQLPNDESRNTLLKLQLDRAHMAAQYSPSYPLVKELDRKIAEVQGAVKLNSKANFYTNRETRNPTLDLLNTRLVTYELEADSLNKQLAELDRQREQAQVRNIELLAANVQLHNLQRQQGVLDTLYKQFAIREASARIEEDAARVRHSNVHVVEQPTANLSGTTMAASFLLAGLSAGILVALMAGAILTWLRGIYASPREAEQGLGLPLLTTFPATESFDVRNISAPSTNLASLLSDLSDGQRTFSLVQFMSTAEEDSCVQLVRSVAAELAQAHGRKTLLVDLLSDGREHFTTLGSHLVDVRQSVEQIVALSTNIPKLWIAYEARHSRLADAHATQKDVQRIIERLRTDFDMTLILGPPTLDLYATRRLTVLADANIIVVRGEKTASPAVQKLRDNLLACGGHLLGLVFTGQRRIVPEPLERLLQTVGHPIA